MESDLHVVPLPALADNYIWLLHDDHGQAIVVDPGEAGVVEAALAERRLALTAILLTHHHHDHIDGAISLRHRHGAQVYAPDDVRIEGVTHTVVDGDSIEIDAPAARFRVIAVPGHTFTHVAYAGEGLLLAGDTLFSLGCGRLFEGTAAQMLGSLDRLAVLPPETLLCCGHEYTEANGRFARTVEPGNAALEDRLKQVADLRRKGLPSLPVALRSELEANPFLRIDTPELMAWGQRHGIAPNERVARFAALRAAKDVFKG
jgi:hydroxyacylglutathione hydrolase